MSYNYCVYSLFGMVSFLSFLKSKNFIRITGCLLAFLLLSSAVILLFCGKNKLSKGELCVVDRQNNILAQFSAENDSLEFTADGYEDYVKNVIFEALTILDEICFEKVTAEKLLKSDIKITTYFSKDVFTSLEKALRDISFDDGKSVEATVCYTNGKIAATIGKNKTENAINFKHKAGSAIKPLSVYAPALNNGIIDWTTTIKDSPFKKISEGGNLRSWPANYEGRYLEKEVSVKYAVKKSLNTAAVSVLHDLTPRLSCEFLEKIGIDVSYEKEFTNNSLAQEVYGNLALGELKNGITCEEIAAAYQIFANGGTYTKGHCVCEIYLDEKRVYTDKLTADRVLKESESEIMNLLLQSTLEDGGTARNARIDGFKIAGKTGTSQEYKDNWFVGVTPDYICAVWYGYDVPQTERGENLAVNIFKNIALNIPVEKTDFQKNDAVKELKYCVFSGKLSGERCRQTESGYFDKDKLPPICDKH